MHFIRKIFLLLSFVLFLVTAKGQDPAFSQYYASALYLNPAMAGTEQNWTLSMNYRSQWSSILANPYITSQASFVFPFYSKGATERHWGGAGVSVFNDRSGMGFLSSTGVNANFAYNLSISAKQDLIFGLQAGFIYKSIDLSSLQWGSDIEPSFTGPGTPVTGFENIAGNRFLPDIGAGILYYINPERDYEEKGYSAFMGFSAYHLNQPDESMVKGNVSYLPFLLKAHAGVEISFSDKVNWSPNLLYAYQNSQDQLNVGSYFTFMFSDQKNVLAPTAFIAGGWYRLRDAVIFSAGLGNAYYTLGFSYDLNSSSLRNNTRGRGAYEISLRITKPREGKKVRYHTPRI